MPKGIKGFQIGNKARKKAPHTIQAAKAKEFIIKKLCAYLTPIIDKLIEEAKNGDKEAIKILFDRAFGKPTDFVDLTTKGESINNSEELKKLSNDFNKFLKQHS